MSLIYYYEISIRIFIVLFMWQYYYITNYFKKAFQSPAIVIIGYKIPINCCAAISYFSEV